MSSTGYSKVIHGGAGAGSPSYCIVWPDDVAPRVGDTVQFAALVVDERGLPVGGSGIVVNFTLWKNGSTASTTGATLDSSSSVTAATGIATTTVTFDASAAADDVFQVYAVPA